MKAAADVAVGSALPEHREAPTGAEPFTTHLLNPHGDRHLGFNEDEGRYYRLWQHESPEPLHTGDATFLRPNDINQIISYAVIWVRNHPEDSRGYELIDEVAAGSKAIVMHFAQAAQAPVQRQDDAPPQPLTKSARAQRCSSRAICCARTCWPTPPGTPGT